MKRIAAKLVLGLLTLEQTVHCLEICEDLCQRASEDDCRESSATTGLRLRPRDKAAVLKMEESFIATTTEGETMPQLFEEHALHFLISVALSIENSLLKV